MITDSHVSCAFLGSQIASFVDEDISEFAAHEKIFL